MPNTTRRHAFSVGVSRIAPILAPLVVFFLASCGHGRTDEAREGPSEAPERIPAERPHPEVAHEAAEVTAGDVRYTLHRFRFDLATTRLDFTDLAFERPLESALEESNAALVVNGGYWDRENRPEGLAIARDHHVSDFSASLGGGVLVVDQGHATILDAEAEGFEPPSGVDFAVQCMPRLVVDGAVNIRRDDGRRADRTALCIRDGGRTLDVVLAKTEEPTGHGGPSLYAFAEKLVEDGCEQALNLDGGGSTGAAYFRAGAVERVPPRTPLRLAILFYGPTTTVSTSSGVTRSSP
jgi:uncharacterized protein YigE (DUF2233 family)